MVLVLQHFGVQNAAVRLFAKRVRTRAPISG